ncbi:MAG: type ISP restriction/modification enzyme [Tepidisphaeraceae bacterium]
MEVLNWTASVLNRVDRSRFFSSFEDEHAVQYFYEPFLEAYDPELRKELGVWYTPRDIVKYQVARVDTVLREELNLPDGLADPNVIVLDPCCGTGAYLIEVLHRIERTIRDKHDDALVGHDLKTAAMTRVFGFEIMPAPFVIAHLQIGLLVQQVGLPFSASKGERAAVYLTNSLTGWEPPKGPKQQVLSWAELQDERDAAEHVKQESKILVVLGNPPYNAFAGVSPQEEQGLVEPYKKDLNKPTSAGGWGIKKFNLDDLYIRFFRLAERRIAEMSGKGVVSFISNFSYLGDPSFVVMRQRFLAEFDKLWFDCMNGDSRETGKLTPDGKPDPSVFSTDYNREGIRVGTAICVMVRKAKRDPKPTVLFRQFWGVTKRQDLLASLDKKRGAMLKAAPASENRNSFRPEDVATQYSGWPKLTELSAVAPFNGPVERRGGSLISVDRQPLHIRLKAYFDARVQDTEVAALHPSLMMTGNRIVGPEARRKLLSEHEFDPKIIVRYPFKVFDVRWAYLANIRPLFSEPSPQLLAQRFPGNAFFISRDTADKVPEGPPFFFSRVVCDYDSISGHARHFPILLRNGSRLEKEAEATLFAALGDKPAIDEPVANLSAPARQYFTAIRGKDSEVGTKTAGLIWMHALAIGFSPAYLTENADGIRREWPRVPLPDSRKALEASAALGEQIAALLDTEAGVPSVTSGTLSPVFRFLCVPSKTGDGELDPNTEDFAVTTGWGHTGQEGVTMPGKGKLTERPYDEGEAKAIDAEAKARRLSATDARKLLGEKTCDVYLNGVAYWRNIPLNVWEYYIGGYQVIKKWLSYREDKILGRALKPEEAREVTNMARRIAAIILLQPKLDENYRKVKAATFDWP